MRLELNLATQPYGEARQFLRRWTIILIAFAVLTIVLGYWAISAFNRWRVLSGEQNRLRQQIAELDRQRDATAQYLARPENRDTRDRSQFLNSLLARKAVSWTQVFVEMERLMPAGAHVVAVEPEINEANEPQLNMVVGATSRDRAIELVRRLEGSDRFANARVLDEAVVDPAMGGTDRVEFRISAVFVPNFGGR